jgi:hypothetical protein
VSEEVASGGNRSTNLLFMAQEGLRALWTMQEMGKKVGLIFLLHTAPQFISLRGFNLEWADKSLYKS